MNEAVNAALHAGVPSSRCGPEKAACNVATRVFQWNIGQAIRRCGATNYHTHWLSLLHTINVVAGRSTKELPFPDVTAPQASRFGEQLGFESDAFLEADLRARMRDRMGGGDGSGDEEEDDDDDQEDEEDEMRTRGPGNTEYEDGSAGAGAGGRGEGSSAGQGPAPQTRGLVLAARPDGRCGYRSILHAARAAGLVGIPADVDLLQVSLFQESQRSHHNHRNFCRPLQGNDLATLTLLRDYRSRAAFQFQQIYEGMDEVERGVVDAVFDGDDYGGTIATWRARYEENDDDKLNTPAWADDFLIRGFGELLGGVKVSARNLAETWQRLMLGVMTDYRIAAGAPGGPYHRRPAGV